MKQTGRNPSCHPTHLRWVPGWALAAGVLAAATTFLTSAATAGPKGMIVIRPLGNAKITVDGDISDWPLDRFTQVAEQPLFPEGQNRDSTAAMGDHVVFDVKRVGFFNDTMPGAFTKNVSDFGSSLYFAYDSKFLYILDVCIDDVLRDDKDTTDFGSEGFRNDGVEFLLDMKGDATGCFDSATYPSEVQVAVSLNKNFRLMCNLSAEAVCCRHRTERFLARKPTNRAT